ncbi:MAG TPA: hypothetical protein VLB87_02250 [Pyrinomonadaceae bacterium]|nr:hypothetical protein [Pyrinomonadaceae bacterium]
MQYVTNPRVRAIWERFCDYELGHLHMVMELMKKIEKRYNDLTTEFETALEHEEQHLQNVRAWLSDCVLDSAEA